MADDYSEERRISRDRNTIRDWGEEHGYVPVRHRDRDDVTLVSEDRIEEDHERLDWDDFHNHLDEEDRVVTHRGETADETLAVTDHDTVASEMDLDRDEMQDRLIEGETITTEIEETTVVETVVVEEASIESELIDTEVVGEEVVDVELLNRECHGCDLVADGDLVDRDWFDEDRYRGSLGGTRDGMTGTVGAGTTGTTDLGPDEEATETTTGTTDVDRDEEMTETTAETTAGTTEYAREDAELEFPYDVEIDVEEAWAVQREITERFTVESRIADTDVTEADTIRDQDIDFEGLQREIINQGLIDTDPDRDADEVLAHCDVETEFAEGDAVHTHFERSRLVEDDVVDTMHVYAQPERADLASMDVAIEEDELTDVTEETTTTTTEVEETDVETTDVETTDVETTEAETEDVDEVGTDTDDAVVEEVTLSENDVGKQVVDATGATVGEVTRVTADGNEMFVDAHHGIGDRIKSALNWGSQDDEDYAIYASQVEDVDDDRIRLKGHEELDEAHDDDYDDDQM